MITNVGREQHLKLVSGSAVRFADKFVVGASNAALGPEATELDLAWGECLVKDSFVDYERNQVVFYGTLEAEYAGHIAEIGLATMNSDFVDTGKDINAGFYFSDLESWNYTEDSKMSYGSGTSIIGTEDIVITGAVAGESLKKGITEDLTYYSQIKTRVTSSVSGTMTINIYSDESNYLSGTLNLIAGNNINKILLSDMIETGSFDRGKLAMMEFVINTPGDYIFDAAVFSGEGNAGLVTRSAVSVPKIKHAGNTMELEYAVMLDV